MNDKWEILHGDALKLLGGFAPGAFDAVITDPPYASGGRTQAEKNKSTAKKYSSMGDAAPPPFDGDAKDQRSFTWWMTQWLCECWRIARDGAPLLVFTDWRQLPSVTDAVQAAVAGVWLHGRAGDLLEAELTAYGVMPEAVAEHAMALALAVTRRIHKSYIKVRENNFSLVGLTGMNFYGKTAGIIGTGKIGAAMCRICHGFGMKVQAYDMYRNPSLDFVEYVDLDTLLSTSDLISLHCPLTDDSYHMICTETINKMKDNVILVNTSRGALIKTEDLITGNRNKKFFGIGLDVYEEETNNVFENREDDILESSITARLLSFPNVIVTSHQGFLTEEALEAISRTTLDNARDYENGTIKDINAV